MNTAIEILTAELRIFEQEYMTYTHRIEEAKKYDTRTHVANLKLMQTTAWVRVATVNNLINQLLKQAETVEA
jgi:hypothetical protein